MPQTRWRLLVTRLADKAPGVRAKALGVLAPLLGALHDEQPARQLLTMVQMPLPIPAPSDTPADPSARPTPGGPTPGTSSLADGASPAEPRGATPASAPYARSTRVASATRLAGWLKGIAGRLAHERRVGSQAALAAMAGRRLESAGVRTGA